MDKKNKMNLSNIDNIPINFTFILILMIMSLGIIFSNFIIFILSILIMIWYINEIIEFEKKVSIKSSKISKNIKINSKEDLNNIFAFNINNKKVQAYKTEDTKYIQDSKDKPYMIIELINYQIRPIWYINKNYINQINNHVTLNIEEIHY